jgi:hypothetical protein
MSYIRNQYLTPKSNRPTVIIISNFYLYLYYFLNFELRDQKEKFEYYANNDILTDSYNRRGGMKLLEQTIRMSKRYHLSLTICFVDID